MTAAFFRLCVRLTCRLALLALGVAGCAVEGRDSAQERRPPADPAWATVQAALVSDGFRFPLDDPNGYGYKITQNYAEFGSVIAGKHHTGTDIGVPCGKAVYAVSHGTVVTAMSEAQSGGWGNVLLIRHDLPDGQKVYSLYGHNTSLSVGNGADVTKGQKIATSGTTGFSTGCHLHFEIKKNSTLGPGYTAPHPDSQGYYKPEDFINSHKTLGGGDPGGSCCGQKIGSSGETVLDEQGSCFSKAGTPSYWHDATDKGWAGHMFWTYTTNDANPDNYGMWKLSFGKAGKYAIDVFIPGNHATSKKAKYIVKAKGSQHSVVIDQSPHYDKWVNLGTWDFDTSCDQWVRLNDNTGEAYNKSIWLGLDAVRVAAKSITCGDCNDNNPCTADSCNSGTCEHKSQGGACDDGNPCTSGDSCQGGGCQGGSPKDCSSLNGKCTVGQCQGGSCVALDKPGGCDDGDGCTVNDACKSGKCQGSPKDCAGEAGPCKTGSCSGGVCKLVDKSGGCDDGDGCTVNDACQGGACLGKAKDCAGVAGPCATGACQGGACVAKPTAGPCDDGNGCTEGDACQDGQCKGAPKVCDDLKSCTEDLCQGGKCVFTPIPSPNTICAGQQVWSVSFCGTKMALLQDCTKLGGCKGGQCLACMGPEGCPDVGIEPEPDAGGEASGAADGDDGGAGPLDDTGEDDAVSAEAGAGDGQPWWPADLAIADADDPMLLDGMASADVPGARVGYADVPSDVSAIHGDGKSADAQGVYGPPIYPAPSSCAAAARPASGGWAATVGGLVLLGLATRLRRRCRVEPEKG